jgi:hypothetical protein
MANNEHNTNRRLFLAAGSAAAVFGSLKAAVAATAPAFNAKAYIAALRGAGHEVELCGEEFGINAPRGFGDAFFRVHDVFERSITADPNWIDKVRAEIRAELLA